MISKITMNDPRRNHEKNMPLESNSNVPQSWQDRLTRIMETMRELSTQTDPQAMVHEYYERMRQVNPHIDRRLAISRRGLQYPQFRITRFSEWDEDINPWKEQDRLPLLSGGVLAELIYGDDPIIINDLVVSPDDPAAEYLSEQRSLQAIPLLDQGKSLNMALHTRRVPDGFSYEKLPEAVWLANLFGRATNNLVIAEQLKVAYEDIDRELKAVARIQRSLLPKHLPKIVNLKLAAEYRTARRAGGDYYDFFPVPDHKWGLLIADVSGHGTPAAVVMAVIHSIAHTYPGPPGSPSRMLDHLNDQLCRHYVDDTGTFVTAFYGIFDPHSLTLCYASAGHNPPRLRSSNGMIKSLDQAQTFPLGMFTFFHALEATVSLQHGDQVVLYTDGIVEAMSRNRELFGTEQLDAELSGCGNEPGKVIAKIMSAVDQHALGMAQSDDQTIVVCQVV